MPAIFRPRYLFLLLAIAVLGVATATSAGPETVLACGNGECVTPTVEIPTATPTPELATITIRKDTDPESDSPEFDFRLATRPGNDLIANFDLRDDESETFTVDPGAYDVEELAILGWSLLDIDCDGTGETDDSDVIDRDVVIEVDAGESVTCEFTNAPVVIPTLTPLPTSTPVVTATATAVPPTATATATSTPPPAISPPDTGSAGLR